mmetsp:Transcript_59677/g.194727  ORF Transcript_59677/g.194727 Transcript_59677/m.194727 type:complete len:324 (+) Transcript_59677:174-1145(+)
MMNSKFVASCADAQLGPANLLARSVFLSSSEPAATAPKRSRRLAFLSASPPVLKRSARFRLSESTSPSSVPSACADAAMAAAPLRASPKRSLRRRSFSSSAEVSTFAGVVTPVPKRLARSRILSCTLGAAWSETRPNLFARSSFFNLSSSGAATPKRLARSSFLSSSNSGAAMPKRLALSRSFVLTSPPPATVAAGFFSSAAFSSPALSPAASPVGAWASASFASLASAFSGAVSSDAAGAAAAAAAGGAGGVASALMSRSTRSPLEPACGRPLSLSFCFRAATVSLVNSSFEAIAAAPPSATRSGAFAPPAPLSLATTPINA